MSTPLSTTLDTITEEIATRLGATCEATIAQGTALLEDPEIQRKYVIADDRGNALHKPAIMLPLCSLEELYLFPFRDAAQECLRQLREANPSNPTFPLLSVRLASITTLEAVRQARGLLKHLQEQFA